MVFDLQGHRGARGLKPENTFPSFEAALDTGVTSIETDVHLTSDGVPVLMHDPHIGADHCCIRSLTLAELRQYRVDVNPDPRRFPHQDASVTPLAQWFGQQFGLDPYAPPTLADFLAFVDAYAGAAGASVGKTDAQRATAAGLQFDLELKRVPFHPALVNDGYTGDGPAILEQCVVEAVRTANVVQRTSVRSFDHRCVRFARQLEPAMMGAVLTAHMAPVSPADLTRAADAKVYCPSYEFLDEALVRRAHAAGVRVLPWTVNEPQEWARLLDWGVDGITTDYPDRLADWLENRGIAF